MKRREKGIAHLVLVLALVGIISLGFVMYYLYKKPATSDKDQIVNDHEGITSQTIVEQRDALEDLGTEQKQHENITDPEEKILKEWSSYESEKFGFSFGNPGDFFLVTTYEDYYPDQGHIHVYEMEYWDFITGPPQPRGGPPLIEISAFENVENLGLIEWAEKNNGPSNYNGVHEKTILDGKEAIRYTWEGMGKGETVLALNENTGLIISVGMFVTEDLVTPYENVLSSFKFTD